MERSLAACECRIREMEASACECLGQAISLFPEMFRTTCLDHSLEINVFHDDSEVRMSLACRAGEEQAGFTGLLLRDG